MLLEVVALCHKLGAGPLIVLLVLVVDLHEELGEGVEVPYRHLFLDAGYQFLVGRGQDAEPEAGHSVTLGDALHYGHVWILFQCRVTQQGVSGIVAAEVHETLVHDEPDAPLPAPSGQPQNVGLGDEVA